MKIMQEDKMKQRIEYYLEQYTDGLGSGIWAKIGNIYYASASLFYKDKLCEDRWIVFGRNLEEIIMAREKGEIVFYNEEEIKDEIESPLIRISWKDAENILSMKGAPEEIFIMLKGIYLNKKEEK